MRNFLKTMRSAMQKQTADPDALSQLPDATKRLIVRAGAMAEDVEQEIRTHGYLIDLTCKLQLRDDCAAVRKELENLQRQGATEDRIQKLWNATLRLRVCAENILHMEFDW